MIKYNWNQEYIIGGMYMITRTFKQVELNGQKTILTEKAINALNKAGVKLELVKEVKMVMDENFFIDNATAIE